MRALTDYAQRTYQGMLIDVYQARWKVYLEKLGNNLETGAEITRLSTDDYYHLYRQWIMSGKEYTREANEGYDYLWQIAQRVLNETESNISASANTYGNLLFEELIARVEGMDRDLYTQEQLAQIDAAAARAKELAEKTLTRSEYLTAVEELYDTIPSAIADSSKEAAVDPIEPETPETPDDDASGAVPADNLGLVIGLSVGGAVIAAAAIVTLIVLLRRKSSR